MYLHVAVISQERVIYLYADSDSNGFNENSQGSWGWSACGGLLTENALVLLRVECDNNKKKVYKKRKERKQNMHIGSMFLEGFFFFFFPLSVFVCYPGHLYGFKTLETSHKRPAVLMNQASSKWEGP